MPPSPIPSGYIDSDETWASAGGRVFNGDPRTVPATHAVRVDEDDVPLGGILDVDAERWLPLPDLPGKPHVYDPGPPKGSPQI